MRFQYCSDGARILISGALDTDLAPLQNLFERLGRERNEFSLSNLPFIVAIDQLDIVAKSTSGTNQKSSLLSEHTLFLRANSPMTFERIQTSERWMDLVELIDPIIKSTAPCHQYLTESINDDAIIVLSKGEYSSEGMLL
ncbi:MAG: hypothetical protein ACKVS6_14395 [Planctomycetota bacterium]